MEKLSLIGSNILFGVTLSITRSRKCSSIFTGGYFRLTMHLAGYTGVEFNVRLIRRKQWSFSNSSSLFILFDKKVSFPIFDWFTKIVFTLFLDNNF